MRNYRRHFLWFISFFAWLGCQAPSHAWKPGNFDRDCFKKFVPEFQSQWYKASVDVAGKHLSGLLLFKSFGDTTRVVFTSEAGTTFFDFGFGPKGSNVNFAVPQINKGPVIRTLQNDLELVLMRYERDSNAQLLTYQNKNYLRIKRGKKTIYLIGSEDCNSLTRIEEEWGGKTKVAVTLNTSSGSIPDSVFIVHHNFNMQINLRKLQQ